jgi:hypothetical protein
MSAVKPMSSDGYEVKRANPADVEAIFQPLRDFESCESVVLHFVQL